MKPLQQFFQKKLQFLQSLRKRYVRQFVCYQAKQWTGRTKILVLPDTNRQEHISGKHNGALSAHCIVRKRAALAGQSQHRFAGFEENLNGVTQTEHIARLNDIVLRFMIEKKAAVDNIEEICSIPGVDMVQFGPADYSMSLGWNRSEHAEEWKAAERKVIETALRHGVQPRCEISSPDQAQYYIDLGARHFSLGDQLAKLKEFWNAQGWEMREIVSALETD